MLGGDLGATALAALTGGAAALEAVAPRRSVRPLRPMLASTAEGVADALATVGGLASVEWKLDGARIQVHTSPASVRVFTRNLNDVTHRLPEVVDVARPPARPARSCSTARRSPSARTGGPAPSRTR